MRLEFPLSLVGPGTSGAARELGEGDITAEVEPWRGSYQAKLPSGRSRSLCPKGSTPGISQHRVLQPKSKTQGWTWRTLA